MEGGTVKLDQGGSATWFVVPADGDAAKLAELAANPVTAGSVGYEINGEQVTTKLGYESDGGTAFAAMPHQSANLAGTASELGTLPELVRHVEALLRQRTVVHLARVRTDLGARRRGLSGAEKKELADQVAADITGTKPFPADTYFGGKALYRAAMLLQLAEQLELEAPAKTMRDKLTAELTKWTDPAGLRRAGRLLLRLRRAGQGDRRA